MNFLPLVISTEDFHFSKNPKTSVTEYTTAPLFQLWAPAIITLHCNRDNTVDKTPHQPATQKH